MINNETEPPDDALENHVQFHSSAGAQLEEWSGIAATVATAIGIAAFLTRLFVDLQSWQQLAVSYVLGIWLLIGTFHFLIYFYRRNAWW